MADVIITKRELIDAQKDAKTLEDVINGAADTRVTARMGRTFWTLATLNSKLNSVETAATQAIASINLKVVGVEAAATQGLININNDVASVETVRVAAESQMNVKVASVEQIFDNKLSEWDDEAQTEINEWRSAISLITQEGGVPALAVSDASGVTQQEINNDLREKNDYQVNVVNYDTYNTPERYGADASSEDNTAALQSWLDSATVLHIRPFKVYKFSGTLTLTVTDQTIIGLTHQKYGNARLLYTGSGSAISVPTNVGYFSPKSWSLVCQVTEAGAAFKPSTVGIDIPSGTTIEAFDWSLMGFERLYSGAGTSYYNKFYFCRFSSFNEGFYNIASYNNNYVGCRWEKFSKALRVLGGSGPLNINHCSFERFNGNIIDSFSSKCLANFTNNYVEIMDNEELPLHYVQANNQTKGGFWGGNVLFSGLFASLNINKNQLSMAGVFRVGNFTECDALDSSGNIFSLYITGNNLDRLFQNAGQYTSFNVNDVIYGNLGPVGGYSRTYARSPVSLKNVRNKYFYYDCILDKVQPLFGSLATINPANGWSANAANEPNIGAIALDDGSTFLGGALYGTVKTSNVALTVPASHRPVELGVTQASCVLRAVNIADGVNVLFKYTYSNGELELLVTTPPATLGNVLLNVVIPPRR